MNLWLDQLVGCESVVGSVGWLCICGWISWLVVNLWLDQLIGCEYVVRSVGCESVVGSVGWL